MLALPYNALETRFFSAVGNAGIKCAAQQIAPTPGPPPP